MNTIKPRINLAGYKKALHEYGQSPSRIVEELVANSYDADATVVVVLHSTRDIVVIDDGAGISEEQFPKLLDLGAGSKIDRHESQLKRSYLGSFGFGIKSTINISRTIAIATMNKLDMMKCEIDVSELESKGFDENWSGFPIHSQRRTKSPSKGTMVWLQLKEELTHEDIENIKSSLYNLPKTKDFTIYLIHKSKAGPHYSRFGWDGITHAKANARKFRQNRISGTLQIGSPKIIKCSLTGSDTIDVAVWCHGLDTNMKVESLGQFAGVYVKVDDRVLKRNFQGEKALDGISKYPKFKHGMRVEVPIDWVKNQISLGRDGLQFSNDASRRKFENELKTAVSTAVRPFAKQLETHKLRKAARETNIRLKKAQERIAKKQLIKELVSTGYAFVPTDDYEMALVLANPKVIKRISRDWVLMDFNGQLDYDCLVYDRKVDGYIKVELEPKLDNFLSQDVLDHTDFVVAWTRGEWKVGRTKRGKRGFFELVPNTDGLGQYKLLVKSSERAQQSKYKIPVVCIDQLIRA
jgi:hypothetical protein